VVASVATTVGAWVAIAAGGTSALVAALSYRGKARADEAESDVRLAAIFGELVPLANARGGAALSETAVAKLLDSEELRTTLRDAGGPCELAVRLKPVLEAATVSLPVGRATQAATLTALGELGNKHALLREPVRSALIELAFLDEDDQPATTRGAYKNARARVGLI
jgi:hypothetical protein